MDNLENAISGILSDPDAMKKIQELSQSLGLAPQQAQSPSISNKQGSGIDMSSISNVLSKMTGATPQAEKTHSGGSLNPEILSIGTRLMPLLSSFNREDESTALLNALRPFLSEQKCRRLDEASKILRIMRLLPAIKDMGIFQ